MNYKYYYYTRVTIVTYQLYKVLKLYTLFFKDGKQGLRFFGMIQIRINDIQDHLDHDASKELTNPYAERICWFL